MDHGTASVLGTCAYLYVVVVTCTGIIVSKLDQKKDTPRESRDEEGDV